MKNALPTAELLPLIENIGECDGILICRNKLPDWDAGAIIRAFGTFQFAPVPETSMDGGLEFFHSESGTSLTYSGASVAIAAGGFLIDAMADLLRTLEQIGWRDVDVYARNGQDFYNDLARRLPATSEMDLVLRDIPEEADSGLMGLSEAALDDRHYSESDVADKFMSAFRADALGEPERPVIELASPSPVDEGEDESGEGGGEFVDNSDYPAIPEPIFQAQPEEDVIDPLKPMAGVPIGVGGSIRDEGDPGDMKGSMAAFQNTSVRIDVRPSPPPPPPSLPSTPASSSPSIRATSVAAIPASQRAHQVPLDMTALNKTFAQIGAAITALIEQVGTSLQKQAVPLPSPAPAPVLAVSAEVKVAPLTIRLGNGFVVVEPENDLLNADSAYVRKLVCEGGRQRQVVIYDLHGDVYWNPLDEVVAWQIDGVNILQPLSAALLPKHGILDRLVLSALILLAWENGNTKNPSLLSLFDYANDKLLEHLNVLPSDEPVVDGIRRALGYAPQDLLTNSLHLLPNHFWPLCLLDKRQFEGGERMSALSLKAMADGGDDRVIVVRLDALDVDCGGDILLDGFVSFAGILAESRRVTMKAQVPSPALPEETPVLTQETMRVLEDLLGRLKREGVDFGDGAKRHQDVG